MSRFINPILRYILFLPSALLLQGCCTNAMELDEETGMVIQKDLYPFISLQLEGEDDGEWYDISKKSGTVGTRMLDLNNITSDYTITLIGTGLFQDMIIPNNNFHLSPESFYVLSNNSAKFGASEWNIFFYTDSIGDLHPVDPITEGDIIRLEEASQSITSAHTIPFNEIQIKDCDLNERYYIKRKDRGFIYQLPLNDIPNSFIITNIDTSNLSTVIPNKAFQLSPSTNYEVKCHYKAWWDFNAFKIVFQTDSAGNIHEVNYK